MRPPARFGKLTIEDGQVTQFDEKPQMSEGWINGGFFVLEPGVFDFIPGDVDFAREPLESLADAGQLSGFCHEGFWQCMDTPRDKDLLNSLWDSWASAVAGVEVVAHPDGAVRATSIDGVFVMTPHVARTTSAAGSRAR